jgi:hypothetical protein
MDTDAQCVAPSSERDPDDRRSNLAAQVDSTNRSVIDVELRRLSRRVPWLGAADNLAVIDAALQNLSESLILRPLRNAPHDAAPLLRRPFGAVPADP